MSESLSNPEQLTPEVLAEMRRTYAEWVSPCKCAVGDYQCLKCDKKEARFMDLLWDHAPALISAAERVQEARVLAIDLRQQRNLLDCDLASAQKRIAELEALLSVAKCPNCDGGGIYADGYGEPVQCQWCYEREALKVGAK